MDANLKSVIDHPKKFCWNHLLDTVDESDTIQYSDSFIFLSVLLYIVLNRDRDSKFIDHFIKRYQVQIEKETSKAKKSTNEIEKKFIQLCEKYPIIRDIIYNKEKKILSECVREEDYINYLNTFGGSCREFELFAKYQIDMLSEQNDYRFEAISEVINAYPYSDLFDIEYFETLCESINGISVCYNSEATNKQRETIAQILHEASFDEVSMCYVTRLPLNKLQILKLWKYDIDTLQSIVTDLDETMFLNIKDVKHTLRILSKLTGLLWSLPNNETVLNNGAFLNYENKVWKDNCNETTSSIVTYYALQPIVKTTIK